MIIATVKRKRYELKREEFAALSKTLEVLEQIENDEELSEAIRWASCGAGDIDDTKGMVRTILNLNATAINL